MQGQGSASWATEKGSKGRRDLGQGETGKNHNEFCSLIFLQARIPINTSVCLVTQLKEQFNESRRNTKIVPLNVITVT